MEITIEATLGDLKDYYLHVDPSYMLCHRLHEACGEAVRQFEQTVVRDVVVER